MFSTNNVHLCSDNASKACKACVVMFFVLVRSNPNVFLLDKHIACPSLMFVFINSNLAWCFCFCLYSTLLRSTGIGLYMVPKKDNALAAVGLSALARDTLFSTACEACVKLNLPHEDFLDRGCLGEEASVELKLTLHQMLVVI